MFFRCLASLSLFFFVQNNLAYEEYLKMVPVDFHESMRVSAAYNPQVTQNGRWAFAYNQFNTFVANGVEYENDLRIPKHLHHVWLGSLLPEYAKKFRKTWIDYHPDWSFIFWTDHPSLEYGDIILNSFEELKNYLSLADGPSFIVMDMRKVKLCNQITYEKRTKNYGEKSDLIRYEALYHVGGLYVDTDFECLRSFDDLHYALDFYLGLGYGPRCTILNGLIGAKVQDPILEIAINELTNKSRGANSLVFTGPHFLMEVVFENASKFDNYKLVMFPHGYFYPMPHLGKKTLAEYLKPESYAVHYWKCSWMK